MHLHLLRTGSVQNTEKNYIPVPDFRSKQREPELAPCLRDRGILTITLVRPQQLFETPLRQVHQTNITIRHKANPCKSKQKRIGNLMGIAGLLFILKYLSSWDNPFFLLSINKVCVLRKLLKKKKK